MLFREQADAWIEGLRSRKRHPVKPGTLAVYRSYLDNWVIPRLGDVEVATFGNAGMRAFAGGLSTPERALSPKFMNEVVSAVKQIISSAVNENGDALYPRAWNHDFIDLPMVNRKDQKTPTLSKIDVARAVRQTGRFGAFYAMLAGTGLRIGEALAVRIGDDGKHTGWDPGNKLILVRTQLWRGQEISPKTAAGTREIDLYRSLNQILIDYAGDRPPGSFLFPNRKGGPLFESSIRKGSLKKLKIEGFHAFRRFRATHLREFGVPEQIIKKWLGHEDGEDITDRYSKLADNKELCANWADRAGLGFEVEIRNGAKNE